MKLTTWQDINSNTCHTKSLSPIKGRCRSSCDRLWMAAGPLVWFTSLCVCVCGGCIYLGRHHCSADYIFQNDDNSVEWENNRGNCRLNVYSGSLFSNVLKHKKMFLNESCSLTLLCVAKSFMKYAFISQVPIGGLPFIAKYYTPRNIIVRNHIHGRCNF